MDGLTDSLKRFKPMGWSGGGVTRLYCERAGTHGTAAEALHGCPFTAGADFLCSCCGLHMTGCADAARLHEVRSSLCGAYWPPSSVAAVVPKPCPLPAGHEGPHEGVWTDACRLGG